MFSQDCGGYHVPVVSKHSPAALRFFYAQVEAFAGFLVSSERRWTERSAALRENVKHEMCVPGVGGGGG